MRILSADDVRSAWPMADAIECMGDAFAALARGEVTMPERAHLATPDSAGVTLVMPARIEAARSKPAPGALAVKAVSVFRDNPARGLAKIQAAVLVLDPDTGHPSALLEGSSLTAIRTAAASGLATDLLARPDARTLAVFGAGVQARSHIEAMCAVRDIERIRVFGRTPAAVEQMIDELGAAPWIPANVGRADSPRDALRDADIICATTTSSTPVFEDTHLAPGSHINAVGSFTPDAREVPGATVARAWIVVDQRAAAWTEAGDLIQARDEGLIAPDDVRAELGELVADPSLRPRDPASRARDDETITLFKSVGLAVQDAAAAAAIGEAAEQRDLGTIVEW